MRDFSVCKKLYDDGLIDKGKDFFIGMAPGKFDTKQLVLCTLAVFANRKSRHVSFIRTLDSNVLRKCDYFINDDFVSMIPMIPSYYDISLMWEKNFVDILRNFSRYNESPIMNNVKDLLIERFSNLYSMDCLMSLYNPNDPDKGLEKAIDIAIILFTEIIERTINDVILIPTIEAAIENMKGNNYIYIPLYSDNWRQIILENFESNNLDYVIFPDTNGSYVIGSMDEDFKMSKHIKGIQNVAYSGKFYVKVADIKTAEKIITKLPRRTLYGNKRKHA